MEPRDPRRQFSARIFTLLLVALLLTLPGCITRTVRTGVYDRDGIKLVLRGERRGRSDIDRGYDQPASISAKRLANIIGAIDVEVREEERVRRPVFYAEQLEPVSSALSSAFEQANSSQQIAVTVVRKHRRLGLFHRKYLTSLVAYMEDRYLYLDFSYVDFELDKQKEDKIREPVLGGHVMKFRAIPARGMHAAGVQTVAARWRDPLFDQPLRARSDEAPGKIKQRTILLETPIPSDEVGAQLPVSLSDHLDPDTLRKLADLEEERRAGSITEGEYSLRRESLLKGNR